MPVYVVKGLLDAKKQPRRHADRQCPELREDSRRAEQQGVDTTPEKRNNTRQLKVATSKCPTCMTDDALKAQAATRRKEAARKKTAGLSGATP
jgi:hypothetical protein